MKKYGSDVEIAVYLDVVPDNKNTVKEYNKIKEYLDTLRNHKVVILPIPCMEYYFLMSIHGRQVEIDNNQVKVCLSRGWWKGHQSITTEKDKKFCTSFEKFCKLTQIKVVKECARQQGNLVEYFENNCDNLCSTQSITCEYETKEIKCARFLKQLPCVPAGQILSKYYNINNLTFEQLVNIHRQLVDDYNKQASLYRKELLRTEFKGKRKLPKQRSIGSLNYII